MLLYCDLSNKRFWEILFSVADKSVLLFFTVEVSEKSVFTIYFFARWEGGLIIFVISVTCIRTYTLESNSSKSSSAFISFTPFIPRVAWKREGNKPTTHQRRMRREKVLEQALLVGKLVRNIGLRKKIPKMIFRVLSYRPQGPPESAQRAVLVWTSNQTRHIISSLKLTGMRMWKWEIGTTHQQIQLAAQT